MKYILAIIISFSISSLFAQGLQLAGVEYYNHSNSDIEDAEDGQKVAFQEIKAFLNIPIKLKNGKTILLNGLNYKYTKATLSNSPLFESDEASKNLHNISYALTLVHRWNKWVFLASAKPTLASDFEEKVSSDDFLFQGTLLLSRKVGSKITVGAGVTYTPITGDPGFLPTIQVKMNTKKNTLDVLLPTHAIYLRHLGIRGKISIGAKAETDGNNYHVTLKQFNGADPSSISNIIYSRINMGPMVQYKMNPLIRIHAFGGMSVRRTYEFDGTDDMDFDYDSKNAPFINVGISLSAPRKK